MAQHILDRIRVRQIEWKERHQWMVLNLSITSCENFVRKLLHLQEITTMLKVDSSCRHAREWPPGITKGEKKGGKHIKEFLTVLFPSCEVFAAGYDWRNKATRTSTTFRVCSQINDHTHVRNADKDGGGIDAACAK